MDKGTAEVRSVLDSRGMTCVRVERISSVTTGKKSARPAFRAELPDGSMLKLRRFESIGEASRLAGLRSRIDAPFLPTIECLGTFVLEPWVSGEQISSSQADERAAELGALLGRLHAATPSGHPDRMDTRERRDLALLDLDRITAGGVLAHDLGRVLQDSLVTRDPGEAPTSLVHRDFCPENIVVDALGNLHIIDNEWLGIDAPGVDLGRTWTRWPMSDGVWNEFLRGYSLTAPHPPAALRFWMIVTAARGTIIRLDRPPAELAVPLRRLRELALSAATE